MNSNLFDSFRDEQAAYRFVEACVWSDGPKCPHCGGTRRIGELKGRSTQFGTYKCYHCRKLFTVRCGTIFQSSHVPLHKWLQAIYLCGCGADLLKPRELSDVLNVTFKTSTFIISRLRAAAIQSGVLDPTCSREPEMAANCEPEPAVSHHGYDPPAPVPLLTDHTDLDHAPHM